jgi:hypothetical protein
LDKNGTCNGQPDTMSGSPIGVYGKLPDQLDAIKIEQGKVAQLILTFDDSTKAPQPDTAAVRTVHGPIA